MKILELTNYSAGICGVFQRVKQESLELSKLGHEVRIFSSNHTKSSDKIAPLKDKIETIPILRFPAKKLGGESFMKWDFESELIKFKPDIIIAHSYRHLHTTKALKIAKKAKIKIFLVTHAPFIDKNLTRSSLQSKIVSFYDKFIGPKTLNKFNKIIYITKWEIPFLKKMKLRKDKLIYIPNGIPEEFFKTKYKTPKKEQIIFLGRISPIKNLETLIKAIKIIQKTNQDITLELVGPVEKQYKAKLNSLIKKLNLQGNIKFTKPIYNLKKKINKLNNSNIFVLPSKTEALPQSLIEAMALGKIVIASKTRGAKEVITNEENGFLFEIGNEKELAKKILFALDKKNKSYISLVQKQAKEKAKQFRWKNLIKDLENLF